MSGLEENLGVDGSCKIVISTMISVSAFIKNISVIYFYHKLYGFIWYIYIQCAHFLNYLLCPTPAYPPSPHLKLFNPPYSAFRIFLIPLLPLLKLFFRNPSHFLNWNSPYFPTRKNTLCYFPIIIILCFNKFY